MLEEVERWLARRSWSAEDRPLDRLLAPPVSKRAELGRWVSTVRRGCYTLGGGSRHRQGA
ncbi:hypothetical protein GCM10020221_05420 [Streptomyces thioluteus]|uniref:Transposase n=1 Tax=Streptomyces thioluteus TaxID=66431 RepID=A0ABP6IWW6_STRTU